MIGICGRLRESVRTLFAFVCVACLILSLGAPRLIAKSRAKIFAQKLVETAVAKHHELSGVELSATPPGGHKCLTIASIETKDLLPGGRRAVIGEKCDEDEFAAMRTGRPFAEKEEDGFDVTVPLHDATGKLIGAVGMGFKPEPGQRNPASSNGRYKLRANLRNRFPLRPRYFNPWTSGLISRAPQRRRSHGQDSHSQEDV